MGISNKHWSDSITMAEIRRRWGNVETAAKKIKKWDWSGGDTLHILHSIAHQILFCLDAYPNHCGPRRKWTDVITKDLKGHRGKQ